VFSFLDVCMYLVVRFLFRVSFFMKILVKFPQSVFQEFGVYGD